MTLPSPAPGSSSSPRIGRAVVAGLCGGLLIGGLGLLAVGIRSLLGEPNCVGLGKQECELIAEAYTHVGRVQTLCGGALVALALSVFVLARPSFQRQQPPASPQP